MISKVVQIYVKDKGYLDVSDEFPFALNFSVADIRDITNRSGSNSKTINLPGTKNNHLIMGELFNIRTSDFAFNLNTKYEINVLRNGVLIFDGYMTLKDITKNNTHNIYNEDTDILYNIILFNKTVDLFTAIDPLNLDDINFKITGHTLTQTNVTESFNHTWIDTYKYFLFNKNLTAYKDVDMWPSIYAKQYINRILGDAGYHYDPTVSTFMTGSPMENLIVPYTGNINMKDPVLWAKERFYGAQTGTTLYNRNLTNRNVFAGITFNDYTAYNYYQNEYSQPIAAGYEVTLGGIQNFAIKVTGSITYSATTDLWYSDMVGTPITFTHTRSKNVPFRVIAYKNGVQLTSAIAYDTGINIPVEDTYTFSSYATPDMVGGSAYTTNFEFIVSLEDLTLLATDVLTLKISSNLFRTDLLWYAQAPGFTGLYWNYTGIVPSTAAYANLTISEIEWYNIPKGTTDRAMGDPVDINDYIPRNVKQRDFLGNIMKMFNLVLDSDKNNTNRIIIKHRDDYYNTNSYIDWTDKVDKSKEQIITYLPELQQREVLLTYRSGDNDYSKKYRDYYNEVYGSKRIVFSSDTITGIDKKEFMFSDCPIVQNGTLRVPAIDSKDPKNLHLLYDGGMVNGNWQYYLTPYSTYPYAGHLDNPYTPTEDLNFGFNRAYFIDGEYTENNLFNIYHYNTFKQISEQRMLTTHIRFTESDIANLKLSDKVVIDDIVYIINKITDYNPISNESTRVELIVWDLLYSRRPSFKRPIWGGQVNPAVPNEIHPIVISKPRPLIDATINDEEANTITPGGINSIVIGVNNTVEPIERGLIMGDFNTIYGGGKNIFVLGSDEITLGQPVDLDESGNVSGGSVSDVFAFGVSNPFTAETGNFYVGDSIKFNANNALISSLTATTFYSGSTDLYDIFATTALATGKTTTPIYLTYDGTSGTTDGTYGVTKVGSGKWNVTNYDAHYYCDCSGGNLLITIPDSDETNEGKTMQFSKPRLVSSDNSVSIRTTNDQNIAQSKAFTLYASDERYEFVACNWGSGGALERKYRVTLGTDNEPYVLRVSNYGTLYTTIKSAVDFANSYANDKCVVLIEPGTYSITEPIIVNSDGIKIIGRGSEITNLRATTSLSGKSMFIVGNVNADFKNLSMSGNGYAYAAIEFSGSPYSEMHTLVIDDFERGICFAQSGSSVWLFDSIIKNNSLAGVCNLGGASIGASEITFENNGYGVNFYTGTTQRQSIQNSIFLVNSGQTGIQWWSDQNTYEYAFFTGNAFYGDGTYISGFTWDESADSGIVVRNNANLQAYDPSSWLWVSGNTSATTLTNQNTYYIYAIDSATVAEYEYIKFSGTGENLQTTYLPSVTKKMNVVLTGELETGTPNQNINIAVFIDGVKYFSQTVRCVEASTPYPFSINGIIKELNQGSYIDIRAANLTSAGKTSTLDTLHFTITAIS